MHMFKKMLIGLFLVISVIAGATKQSTATESTVSLQGVSKETGDLIIANANVMDQRFGAAADGIQDDTAAIQKALNHVGDCGGGIVFLPAGKYKVEGNLHVPHSVTMRGEWENPDRAPKANGTVLMAYAGKNEAEGTPFVTLGNSACLMELSIWYPEQNPNQIVPYPWTIENRHVMVTVKDITLYNAYQGINLGTMHNGSAMHIYNVYATILKNGFRFDNNWEVSEMVHMTVNNHIWIASGLPGCPSDEKSMSALRDYTRENTIGIILGKSDDAFLYDIDIKQEDTKIGIHFVESLKDISPNVGGRVPYGIYSNLHKTKVKVDSLVYYPLTFTDDVLGADLLTYEVDQERRPKSNRVLNVREAPYHAMGDEVTDDTAAIQKALDDMGEQGGGTVFIPSGKYRISTHLLVPEGVEIRGTFESAHHVMQNPGTELHAYEGRNNEKGTAFVTLSANAGIHGISILYPEHRKGMITPYPFTIKGMGEKCWIEYVTIVNGYNLIDFYEAPCHDFLIKKVWATTMNKGICIGGGSVGGKLAYNMITYGVWQECVREESEEDNGVMTKHAERNAVAYLFGDCEKIAGIGNFTYGTSTGWLFSDEQDGYCRSSTFFRIGLDTPESHGNLTIEAADQIRIIGLHTASRNCFILTKPTFHGTVDIYGHGFWAGGILKTADGEVNIFKLGDGILTDGSRNILLSKNTTSSFEPWGSGIKGKSSESVDGKRYSGWVSSDESDEHWLEIDLGDPYFVKRWKVGHAGFMGMGSEFNTSDFAIEFHDGENWLPVVEVKNNKGDISEGVLKKGMITNRVRLSITKEQQAATGDEKARIAEFQLYGLPYEKGIEKRFDQSESYRTVIIMAILALLALVANRITKLKRK